MPKRNSRNNKNIINTNDMIIKTVFENEKNKPNQMNNLEMYCFPKYNVWRLIIFPIAGMQMAIKERVKTCRWEGENVGSCACVCATSQWVCLHINSVLALWVLAVLNASNVEWYIYSVWQDKRHNTGTTLTSTSKRPHWRLRTMILSFALSEVLTSKWHQPGIRSPGSRS